MNKIILEKIKNGYIIAKFNPLTGYWIVMVWTKKLPYACGRGEGVKAKIPLKKCMDHITTWIVKLEDINIVYPYPECVI
jgi:hypothetical protein